MTPHTSVLRRLRRRCGDVKDFLAAKVCSVTRSRLYELSCWQDGSKEHAPVAPVLFRFGAASDLAGLDEAHHEYGSAEKEFGLWRLREGDSLVLGEVDGEVVFYSWLMYGQMDIDFKVFVPLGPQYAYSYKVFTTPAARGYGICAAYYAWITGNLNQQGYRRVVSRIGAGNVASVRAHRRAGFQPVGELWKAVLPGHTFFVADQRLLDWLGHIAPRQCFSSHGVLLRHHS